MTGQDKSGRPRGKAGGRKTPPHGERRDSEPAVENGGSAEPERIAKILARAGIASRRDAERMVMEGRVSVNGAVLETPAVTATLSDRIEVDGVPLRGIERTRLWLYYKPAGLVTTNSDPEGRPTVFASLPADLPRVLSVGRLDINTEGLLLLTNDGGLARVLELPSTGWLRRYRVRAHGRVDQPALDRLKDGIAVNGVLYGAIEATLDRTQGSNVWLTLGLREGKNREVKNVLGALGLSVNRLIRISYGPFQLGDLTEGAVREIRGRTLRDQLGPRLIADAGANFEAPVFDGEAESRTEPAPSSAADVGDGPRRREEREAGRKAPPHRREDRSEKRDRALARLDTRRSEDRPRRTPRSRASNVWMAPGARPLSPKQAKAAEEEQRRKQRRAARNAKPPTARAEPFDRSAGHDSGSKAKSAGARSRVASGPHPAPAEGTRRPHGAEGKRNTRPTGTGRCDSAWGKRESARSQPATAETGRKDREASQDVRAKGDVRSSPRPRSAGPKPGAAGSRPPRKPDNGRDRPGARGVKPASSAGRKPHAHKGGPRGAGPGSRPKGPRGRGDADRRR